MESAVIAALLRELSMYYELDGDRHRKFAYERAANTIANLASIGSYLEDGRLEELPGIGPSIARAIGELARRGNLDILDRMRAKWPSVVLELATLPKLGVIKARALYQAFQPETLEAVAALCRAHAIRELKGFGAVSETSILEAIEDRSRKGVVILLEDAQIAAEGVAAQLHHAGVRAEIAGPVRRWIEEIDHLAFAVDREVPMARLANGLPITLVVAESPDRWGWALIRATGSAEHVALLEARIRERNIEPLGATEAEVYARLGLPDIPPECRDGTDELTDTFTDLIELADLTTVTHTHSTYSDGKHTMLQMAEGAHALGFRGLTVTDHSIAASYAGGLDAARLVEQHAEIRALDSPIRLFHGTEADILADGAIDVPGEMLHELDLVIASVHQRFQLDVDAATARIITAMTQPYFKIWGHALGRLVLRRKPIELRIDDVLDAIAGSPAAIEINGDPHRLDLPPAFARRAVSRGIKFVLSTDAHSVENLRYAKFAVAMARRARIRKRDVLNALPVDEFAAAVAPTRRD